MNDAELLQQDSFYVTTCSWCNVSGVIGKEIEFIVTSSGEKRRCVDREACRVRVGIR